MPANELDVRIGKLSDTPPPVRRGHLELALRPLESSARQEI
jgi:hypothetical protein